MFSALVEWFSIQYPQVADFGLAAFFDNDVPLTVACKYTCQSLKHPNHNYSSGDLQAELQNIRPLKSLIWRGVPTTVVQMYGASGS